MFYGYYVKVRFVGILSRCMLLVFYPGMICGYFLRYFLWAFHWGIYCEKCKKTYFVDILLKIDSKN